MPAAYGVIFLYYMYRKLFVLFRRHERNYIIRVFAVIMYVDCTYDDMAVHRMLTSPPIQCQQF